jgi:cyanophycinase
MRTRSTLIKFVIVLFLGVLFCSCYSKKISVSTVGGKSQQDSTGSLVTYITGDSADVATTTSPGLLLAGGSTDVDSAVKWFLQRSGGGDVVVIRASGADGYNKYMFGLFTVNSVETIIINSRAKAMLPAVADKIRNAEALFIAGGDQWNYVTFWKDTPVQDAINYLLNTKKVPVGGTSAGLAILGSAYFSAQNGSAVSADALTDPYNNTVTLGEADFIDAPFMKNTITDSHYTQRDRQGRHITFLARLLKDFALPKVYGIGIDEQTAVCIDGFGEGKVFGTNAAYFLESNQAEAETCIAKTPLTWNGSARAVKAYRIQGSLTGNGTANLTAWSGFSGGKAYYYYVTRGVLNQK